MTRRPSMGLLAVSRFLACALLTIGAMAGCSHTPSNSPSAPDVPISTDYVFYPIIGSTADQLRAQLDRLGPTDAQGNRFDAYTDWHVNRSYPYSMVDGQCTTGPIQVNVQVVLTFPHWTPSASVSQDLVDQWEAYLVALRRHEDGHKEIAIAAGYAIYQALSELPGYPTCDELERAAEAVGERILDAYRQQEFDYDRNTDHGATQGARFP